MEDIERLKQQSKQLSISIEQIKKNIKKDETELAQLKKLKKQVQDKYLGKNMVIRSGNNTTLFLGIKEVELILADTLSGIRLDDCRLQFSCTKITTTSNGVTILNISREHFSNCLTIDYMSKVGKEVSMEEAEEIVQVELKKTMNNIISKVKCI